MSHPFYTDFDKLASEVMSLAYGIGINTIQSTELVRAKMETICRDYACHAAGMADNDVDKINRLVWYRQDGWKHGGSAISWVDRAEELEKRVIAAEKCIEEIKQLNLDQWGVADEKIAAEIKRWEELDL